MYIIPNSIPLPPSLCGPPSRAPEVCSPIEMAINHWVRTKTPLARRSCVLLDTFRGTRKDVDCSGLFKLEQTVVCPVFFRACSLLQVRLTNERPHPDVVGVLCLQILLVLFAIRRSLLHRERADTSRTAV